MKDFNRVRDQNKLFHLLRATRTIFFTFTYAIAPPIAQQIGLQPTQQRAFPSVPPVCARAATLFLADDSRARMHVRATVPVRRRDGRTRRDQLCLCARVRDKAP